MLLPNNKQRTKMFQYANAARFAYNWAIAEEQQKYRSDNKFISDYDLRKEFTKFKQQEENKWLYNISNDVTKQAIKDACIAYKNFFNHKQKLPKFKSKRKCKPKFYQDCVKIKFTDTHVKFEGIANNKKSNRQTLNWVKLAEKGRIPTNAKYMNPRISYDGIHWWISISIDCDYVSQEKPNNNSIGIDLGIKDFAVCSDGIIYENINKINTNIKNLRNKRKGFKEMFPKNMK